MAALAKSRTPALVTVDRSWLPWHGLEPGFGMDPYVVAVTEVIDGTLYTDDSGLYTLAQVLRAAAGCP